MTTKAMKDYNGIKTLDGLLEKEYEKIVTESRNAYEEKAPMFKEGLRPDE
jgi:hypothetical protein